ncbi:MAG: amidohydrolase [Deltaproteobacteria bacterium]|nr:amidohydrolase [Deltaproteobacteria bacterium]MBW1922936.1 amidohydrolase [Deltaproteobacteria bacterium]MBW1950593.1 amidohydrolase [Deltaproteobacteria bacterium]MBW2009733.1 amidohydrolase [Deltaproteobacteria bacterium]MBW2101605.1 amidohydrolase [Deltaproteobacteria bacterium]
MKAIDVHVHFSTAEGRRKWGHYGDALETYFRFKLEVMTEEEMGNYYREHDIMGVLLPVDDESVSGIKPIPHEYVADMVKMFPDTFIGFAGVDPWKGKAAIEELERAVKDLGLRGAKFQQASQAFFPNDRRFYPLWEKCVELGIPVLFHCGTTGLGAGMPGGLGIKLKYVDPLPIDDVAADFPELKIICAHPAWPWTDVAIAMAVHKANVFVDLSGWSPKYFPPQLVREVNSRLQDKALFGTDYPFIKPDRWLRDFEKLDIKPEVRPKVLVENARKVLGLE